jgi:uncharacterized protein (DUF983 family)
MNTGDNCPKCKTGRLRVRTSRAIEGWQKQVLQCKACSHQENTVVAETAVWRRASSSTSLA